MHKNARIIVHRSVDDLSFLSESDAGQTGHSSAFSGNVMRPAAGQAADRLCHFAAWRKHPPCRRTRFAYHEAVQNRKANGSKTPMGKIVQVRCAAVVGLACLLGSAQPAGAQDAEKAFFAGKTVRMV